MNENDAKMGMAVRYRPSSVSDRYFVGTIDSEPFQCGQTWCVRLRDMPADYGTFCNKKGHKRYTVAAAALSNCEPHGVFGSEVDSSELPVHAELLLLKELCDSQSQIAKHLRNHHLVSLATELSTALEKQAGRAKQAAPLPSKTISKQRRKIDQMKQTINHLHERLARLQASKRNKASQIARLKARLQEHGISEDHPLEQGSN